MRTPSLIAVLSLATATLALIAPAAAQPAAPPDPVDPYAGGGAPGAPPSSPATPAPAAVEAGATARATVLHAPVAESPPGTPVEILAVIDRAWAEPVLLARYRTGDGPWREAVFQRSSAGGWFATIPAEAITAAGAAYYIVGRGEAGEIVHFASAEAPQPIRVEPTLRDRLEQLDDDRLGGRREAVSLDVDGHDFGNRYGNADRFVRAELRWTHRVSRTLHSVGFGFGSIWGRTPDRDGLAAREQVALGRYGSAEVRLRAHPSFFIDGKLMLGVSDEGFLRGGGAAVTFGKPWRSNLSIGGEMIDDLGPTAYVRLQWDTAVPLLMGASIVRTDLPDAQLSANGLYVKYDLAYPVNPGLVVRGAVSFGSRDGAGRLGGGLGVETRF